MKQIETDSSDFSKIRSKNCIYVDKTSYLYSLIADNANNCFFISRPRRFGKSLMLSTLKAIFQGRRELFDGLAIADTGWDWKHYTVLHFKFGSMNVISFESYKKSFATAVRAAFLKAKLEYDVNMAPEENFAMALELAEENSLVILIDEYDDPVALALDDLEKAELIRKNMACFFGQMKDRTGNIRFLMITGVSKFTKLSLFSAMSNLVDLTFNPETAAMLGFTEDELDKYYSEHMNAHADKMKLSQDEYRVGLKRMFNGYRFSNRSEETVYNPVSIVINMSERAEYFISSWAETGKASMLMNYLNRNEFLGIDMECEMNVYQDDFEVRDISHLQPVTLLYQTGYLTIKAFDLKRLSYTLGVPDDEVRRDLAKVLTGLAAGKDISWASKLGYSLLEADWRKFAIGLKSLYSHLPYGPKEDSVQEYSFERTLCVLLASQGIRWRAEDRQADGLAYIVAEHACGVFIFELKVDASADDALQQARRKGYEQPYLASDLPIWFIGLNFDRETRQLLDLKAERC